MKNSEKYGPYIKTKWGQREPFNSCMDGNLVGCVPVAAAQVVFYHHNALSIEPNFCDYVCDWDTLATVYHYDTMVEGTEEAQKQIGHFMLDVKNSCGMKVKRKSGTFKNVEDCLCHYGFKNIRHDFAHFGGDQHDENHLDDVVKSLVENKPVIMLAFCMSGWPIIWSGGEFSWEWCGHAYVIDGYKKDSAGEFFHVNWGWKGSQDGYYARGCFDGNQRYSVEDGLDSGNEVKNPGNYNITHYYVHYEL